MVDLKFTAAAGPRRPRFYFAFEGTDARGPIAYPLPRCASSSHLSKPVRERLTDGQRFGAVLELDDIAARQIARDTGDRLHVDDCGAMDLPELRRIELGRELFERLADQRLTNRGDDARVLRVRLKIADFVDGNQLHVVSEGSVDPAQIGGRLR